jgi:tetratricopeptide (TPR) repeat protein
MLQPKKQSLIIRPQQPLQWLAALGFVALGVILARPIYGLGAWVFALAYFTVGVGFLSDRLSFDGNKLRRCGLGAWCLGLLGKTRELELEEVEAVTSYAVSAGRAGLRFQTVISSEHVRWHIVSSAPQYQAFIKAVFKAVNPHLLDLLSTELLLYWQEADPPFKATDNSTATAYNIERWRRKAIRLSLAGHYEAAASYFKIAHENAPADPQIAYDIGRYLQRRAIAAGLRTKPGEADLLRAETYFRLAGRLAREKKNARLLEKVGEAFYEFQQLEPAQKYFDLATRIDPARPRANVGLAGIALQQAQGARAVYAYHQTIRGAEAAGVTGLVQLAERKAEYCERLMADEQFLQAEADWDAVLTQLKWARRGALIIFLVAWLLQLNTIVSADAVRTLCRELSATALIIWVCALVANHIIWAFRRG